MNGAYIRFFSFFSPLLSTSTYLIPRQRGSPKKSFFDRQKWQGANGSPDVFVEITRSVIPTTKTGQRLCRYRLIELYRVRVLITHRFTYDVLSTTIIENAGNGFSTYSTFSVFPVDTCNSPDFLKCNFV